MQTVLSRISLALLAFAGVSTLSAQAKAACPDVQHCFKEACAAPGNLVEGTVLSKQVDRVVVRVDAVHLLNESLYVVPEVGESIEIRTDAFVAVDDSLLLVSPPAALAPAQAAFQWQVMYLVGDEKVTCWEKGAEYGLSHEQLLSFIEEGSCKQEQLPVIDYPCDPKAKGCQSGHAGLAWSGVVLALGWMRQRHLGRARKRES